MLVLGLATNNSTRFLSPGPVLPNARLVDQEVHGRKGEHLAVGRLQEPTHVFAPGASNRPSRVRRGKITGQFNLR